MDSHRRLCNRFPVRRGRYLGLGQDALHPPGKQYVVRLRSERSGTNPPQFAFQEYIGITNILTDAVLILVPFWVFIPLQMALSTRLVVISLFSTRVLLVSRLSILCWGF